MGKKGSKFLALFMVLAMIVTYSFSMSILSVYADDEQGEVNAKANASEDATPAEPESKPEPKPEPEKPAPSDSGNSGDQTVSDTDTGSSDETGNDATESDDVSSDDSNDAGEPVDSDAIPGEEIINPEELIEEPEEEKYPEVTLSKTVNGVTVTLHAPEGALPEGVTLDVDSVSSQAVFNAVEQRVESENTEMVDAIAFDITPRDKSGHEVQPKKSVTVTFSGTNLASGDINVFHVSGGGSSVSEMGTSVASTNTQQFSTNHFSIYVVSSTATHPQGDGSSSSKRYVLEYGESVTLDSTSWISVLIASQGAQYVSNSGGKITNTNTSNADQNVTITNSLNWSENFYILAKRQTFTVDYMVQSGQGGFEKAHSETVYKNDFIPAWEPTPPEDEDISFYGWYYDEACSQKIKMDEAKVSNNLKIYGKLTSTATITYYKNTSENASVPSPLQGGVGTYVTLGNGTLSGYAFQGWNTKPDGSGAPFDGGQSVKMPDGGMQLYAQWDHDAAKMVIRLNWNRYYGDTQAYSMSGGIYQNSRTTLITNLPVNEGRLFLGWATSRNGAAKYYPGQTINTGDLELDSHNVATLYAAWGNISEDDLTIKQLTANGDTLSYDGQYHTIEGVQEGTSTKHPGYVKVGTHQPWVGAARDVYARVVNITVTGKDAGHYSTPVAAQLFIEGRTGTLEATSDFIEVTNTILWINPAEVIINTFSDEQPYDGTELTAGGEASFVENANSEHPEKKTSPITNKGGAVTLIHNETLNIRTTGSQTEVGTSDNTYEYDWGKPDSWGSSASTAKKHNYKIANGTIGTLTVYLGVSFKENADGDTVNNMPEGLKITDPENAYIPNDRPVREKHDFLGWAKESAATEADYQPGDKLTSDDIGDGLVLYAIWKAKDEPTPTPTPTPSGDDTPGEAGNGGGGGDGAAAAANIAAAADNLTAEIGDNDTPEAATINDNAAPKSAPTSHWALLNLIAAILTIIGSLIAAFRKNSATTAVKGVGLAAAAAGVIVFLVTQNLGAAMQIADGWTILMAALFGVQCVTTGITAKTPAVDD